MPDKRFNVFQNFITPLTAHSKVFLTLCLGVIICNGVLFAQKLSANAQARKTMPYIFLGYKFSGLPEFLAGVKRLGYLTDKDMDDRANAMEFAQAEYILAPLTLDLNNPRHEYLLLNFSQKSAALKKAEELGLRVWKQNQFGVILAKNPKTQDQ